MPELLRDSFLPRRYVLDQKGRDSTMASRSEREQPLEFVTVRPITRPGDRVIDRDAGLAQLLRVALEVIGLHAIVDQPLAFFQRTPPAVIPRLAVEGDDLQIRAVGEGNEHVVAAHRMAPAGHDGEAEPRVILRSLVEVSDDDDEVIDAFKHICQCPEKTQLKAGATSLRKRSNCPV